MGLKSVQGDPLLATPCHVVGNQELHNGRLCPRIRLRNVPALIPVLHMTLTVNNFYIPSLEMKSNLMDSVSSMLLITFAVQNREFNTSKWNWFRASNFKRVMTPFLIRIMSEIGSSDLLRTSSYNFKKNYWFHVSYDRFWFFVSCKTNSQWFLVQLAKVYERY